MRKRLLALGLAMVLLSSCGNKGEAPSDKGDAISLHAPDTTEESEKNIPQVTITEYPLPEEVAALEELDLMEMGLYADKEQSMQNSNQLNFGNLTADGEGNIYFVDYTQNAIFRCGLEGENKELLYEGIGDYLHVANGYLYFGGIDVEKMYSGNLIRIDLDTLKAEALYEGPCGENLIIQDVLYNNGLGLDSMKLDESDSGFVRLSEIQPVLWNTDGRYLLYNMATDEPKFLFQRGYLLAWDTETERNYFVESKINFPLLTGSWFSYMDLRTVTRHVLDLETGIDTDLGYYIQHAAGDGDKLYWVALDTGSFKIMQWDGMEIQEMLTVEGRENKRGDVSLYLTEDYLYWMFEAELLKESDWGYYRLSDGKMGKLN